MDKITFKNAIMHSTSDDEVRAHARIALVDPRSPEDIQLANKILNDNLSVQEAQALLN